MQSSSRTYRLEPTRSRSEIWNWYRCYSSIGEWNEQSTSSHSGCGQAGFRSRGCRIHRRKRGRGGCAFAQSATLGLGLSTIVDFEKSRRDVSRAAVHAMQEALEKAGVQFIAKNGGGPRVRLLR